MIRTCTVFTITSQMITSALPPHCVLDAQKLTSALCALVDLDLTLDVSSLDAAEEVLFILTLKQLNLRVRSFSDCQSSLYPKSKSSVRKLDLRFPLMVLPALTG